METRIRRFTSTDQRVKAGPGSAGIWVNSDGELSYSTLIDGAEETFTCNTLEGDPISVDGGHIEDITIDGEVEIDMSDAASVLVVPQATSPAQTAEGSVVWDSDGDLLTVGDGAGRKTMVDLTTSQTLTNKTLTAPVISTISNTGVVTLFTATDTVVGKATTDTLTNKTLTSPIINGASGQGQTVTKTVTFTEDASHTSHVGTVALPAGSTLLGLSVSAGVLWGATTSATLKVGDTGDDDGYFIDVSVKAADLAVGEVLDITSDTNWGGKEGAYLNSTTGRRGPTTANFGNYYAAGTNILGTITVVDPVATTGRTYMTVTYSVGVPVAAVAS